MLPKNQRITRIGDPGIEFMQGWILDNEGIIFRFGVNAGIGGYHKGDTLNYGKGFWSFHTQLGATC